MTPQYIDPKQDEINARLILAMEGLRSSLELLELTLKEKGIMTFKELQDKVCK